MRTATQAGPASPPRLTNSCRNAHMQIPEIDEAQLAETNRLLDRKVSKPARERELASPASLPLMTLEDPPGAAAPSRADGARVVPSSTADFRELFHPAVAAWFAKTFPAPTAAQAGAWPAIKAGRHTLIAAPTGSGKTLSAFLAALDDLVRQGLEGTPDRRNSRGLCFAAESAVERHPSQPGGAPRGHPERA